MTGMRMLSFPPAAARSLTPGKYIKLLYDGRSRLAGARTEHFLLEKSRVVSLDPGERGYHIFYQVSCRLGPPRVRGSCPRPSACVLGAAGSSGQGRYRVGLRRDRLTTR